jgi:hypothetical protein
MSEWHHMKIKTLLSTDIEISKKGQKQILPVLLSVLIVIKLEHSTNDRVPG